MLRLRPARHREGVSANCVAARLGISAGYLRLLETEKKPLTATLRDRFVSTFGPEMASLLSPIELELPKGSLR